jgi:hypothetical protein
MRGVFNSNRLKDPKKHKFISDLTKENNLNFIALSENRSDFMPRFLKNLYAGEIIVYGIVNLKVDLVACF